jgi:Spy/CpxP family protein refolding chaperone
VRSDGALGQLIDKAVASEPTPVAIVAQAGQAIILTAGESGVIWRQGEETEAQRAQIEVISQALEVLSGGQPSKSPKRRKAQEPAQIEAEPEPEIIAEISPEPEAEAEPQPEAETLSAEEI